MWKLVDNTYNYYVNEEGQVKTVDFIQTYYRYGKAVSRPLKGKMLKQSTNHKGYFTVGITYIGKKQKNVLVHQLVAKAFIPNPESKPHINHIDGNKKNNTVSNLEWCTPGENIRHAYAHGLNHGPHHAYWTGRYGKEHPNSRPVYMCDKKTGEILREFDCMSQAAREMNLRVNKICACVHGKIKSSGGYVWKSKLLN